jgi:hypothetical protein
LRKRRLTQGSAGGLDAGDCFHDPGSLEAGHCYGDIWIVRGRAR